MTKGDTINLLLKKELNINSYPKYKKTKKQLALSFRRRRNHITLATFYATENAKSTTRFSFVLCLYHNKPISFYYIGMTNNLKIRLQQHKENILTGNKTFASKYNLEFLVYYDKFTWVQDAIAREKEMKKWRREKKLDLIRSFNPEFKFLNSHFE